MGRLRLGVSMRTMRYMLVMGVIAFGLLLAACSGSSTTAHSTATSAPSATASATVTSTATWSLVQGWPNKVGSFRFAPGDPTQGYLCALDGPAESPLPFTPHLYKSTDSGKSWQSVTAPVITPISDNGLTPAVGCDVFVDANAPADVFLQEVETDTQGASHVIARALYRSQDGGTTWRTLATIDKTNGFGTILVVNNRLVAYVVPSILGAGGCDSSVKPSTSSDLYGSTDGGASWQQIGQSIESQGYVPYDVIIAAGSPLIAEAQAVPTTNCSHTLANTTFWGSVDGGVTWQKMDAPAGPLSNLSLAERSTGSPTNCGAATTVNFDAAGSGQEAMLYWNGSASGWSRLPALPGSVVDAVVVTPSCTVLAELSAASGGDLGIFAIRPESPAPAWRLYAPGGSMDWQVTRRQPFTLWALSGQGAQSGIQVFFHPEFLPVP